MNTATAEMSVEAFFNSDIPVSEWVDVADAADDISDEDYLRITRDALGRKFDVSDIADGGESGRALYDIAERWLPMQTDASFAWLHDLANKFAKGGGLTDRQAAGVLNCYVAHIDRAPRVVAAPPIPDTDDVAADAYTAYIAQQAQAKLAEDDDERNAAAYREHAMAQIPSGYYTLIREDGERWTIKLAQWKGDFYSSTPDAQRRWIGYLIGANNTSDYMALGWQSSNGAIAASHYAPKNILDIVSAFLAGDEEAKAEARLAYALESGCCARCGRMLTVPASLHRGLGPDCAAKLGY